MANDIIKPNAVFPSNVQQTGENNVNLNNNQGGVVNFNYNINYPLPNNNGCLAEQMIAIESFSNEYYQLFVTCDEDMFSSCVITVPANRALTQHLVPSEIFSRCSTLTEEGIAELKTFPAIICNENTEMKGFTSPTQYAMYGYIKKVQKCGKEIKIVFQPLMPFQQQLMCVPKNAVYFDLNMECAITDLNHSAWSVHKVNLFEAFREAGINNPYVPSKEVK